MTRSIATAAILVLGLTPGLTAQEALTARADLIDRDGNPTGVVTFTETPFHGVLVRIEAWGLEPGPRAIHIHETGICETPDFTSAGGHFNPAGRAHGLLHEHGVHAGDLLNLHVPADGRIVTERYAPHVTLRPGALNSLLEGNGTAVVIHAEGDDYVSQPTGDAGDRVACGVIRGQPL
jgi:superoxide dismutase, Cu-Zn family